MGHNSVTVSKGSFRKYDTLRLFCNHLAFQMLLGLTCLCACLKQRNSHWRVQSLNGHSQSVKNNGPGSAFPGKFDENYIPINPTMLASMHNPVESDPSKALDHQQGITLPMPLPGTMSATNRSDGALGHSLQRPVSDAQTNQCPITNNALNQRNELSVEGGTISMSTAYAQGWVFIQTPIEFLVCIP